MIQIEKKILPFISGEKFSDSLKVEINELFEETTRISLLKKTATHKKIIHVGCVDHLPLIESKITNNIWMHGQLSEAASTIIGVDINKEGIDYLQLKLDINNVVCADITTDDIPEINGQKWDYLILGEVIEHVDNPVYFLQAIREKYKNIVNEIIITAPNILVKNRVLNMSKNSAEQINSDHKYWFSPYTLSKIISQAGYSNIKLDFTNRTPLTKCELILRKFKRVLNLPIQYPFYYFNVVIGIAEL